MIHTPGRRLPAYTAYLFFVVNLGLIVLAALLAPAERTLGANVRLVYLHGSIVSTAMIVFGLAGLAGGLALLFSRRWPGLPDWSQALMRAALTLWLIQLPLSMLSMQLNWGGLFLDEPRWRVSLTYAVVGLLLQASLWLIRKPVFTSVANLVYAVALLIAVSHATSVMHPDAVISQSSLAIQIFFAVLLVLDGLAAGQLVLLWKKVK